MSDPFSVVAGVVGIVGVALSNTRQVYDFISGIKGAPEAVATLSGDLDSLANILQQLSDLTRDPSQALFIVPLKGSLERCIAALKQLERSIKPYVEGLQNGRSKWKRFAWNFKEKEVAALQVRLGSSRENLQLAILLGVLTQQASGSKDIRANFQKLQQTAEGDCWSVVGSSIPSAEAPESDYGYALRRFLLEHETELGSQTGDDLIPEEVTAQSAAGPSNDQSLFGRELIIKVPESPESLAVHLQARRPASTAYEDIERQLFEGLELRERQLKSVVGDQVFDPLYHKVQEWPLKPIELEGRIALSWPLSPDLKAKEGPNNQTKTVIANQNDRLPAPEDETASRLDVSSFLSPHADALDFNIQSVETEHRNAKSSVMPKQSSPLLGMQVPNHKPPQNSSRDTKAGETGDRINHNEEQVMQENVADDLQEGANSERLTEHELVEHNKRVPEPHRRKHSEVGARGRFPIKIEDNTKTPGSIPIRLRAEDEQNKRILEPHRRRRSEINFRDRFPIKIEGNTKTPGSLPMTLKADDSHQSNPGQATTQEPNHLDADGNARIRGGYKDVASEIKDPRASTRARISTQYAERSPLDSIIFAAGTQAKNEGFQVQLYVQEDNADESATEPQGVSALSNVAKRAPKAQQPGLTLQEPCTRIRDARVKEILITCKM